LVVSWLLVVVGWWLLVVGCCWWLVDEQITKNKEPPTINKEQIINNNQQRTINKEQKKLCCCLWEREIKNAQCFCLVAVSGRDCSEFVAKNYSPECLSFSGFDCGDRAADMDGTVRFAV
jgi:hypothetical protein